MSSEWRTSSVDELVQAGTLAPPIDGNHGEIHPKAADFVAAGVPFIMASDLKAGRVDTKGCAFITAKQAATLRKGFARAGDVLLSHKATLGRTAIVEPSEFDFIVLTPQVTYYRVLDRKLLNNRYLKYYFDSEPFQQTLAAWAGSGSTRAYIGITAQRKLPIVLPPIGTQNAVAGIIGALDDRIALLRETNATLEAIAQALFKSWFVDFDPVRAKSQGLAPAGMDDATAALYPDGFGDSALGQMPAGWRAGALSDCAWLNSLSWSTRTRPERVWYLDLAKVKNNEVASMQDFAFEDAPSRARRALRNGDTIVGTVRPGNCSFAYIDAPISGLTASTGFAVLSPKSPEFTAFTYLASTRDVSIEHLAHTADGGAYPAVRPEVVSALPCVLPTTAVLRRFDAIARPMLQKIASNQRQAQSLSALRDALLPRLISGQLRLPDFAEADSAQA